MHPTAGDTLGEGLLDGVTLDEGLLDGVTLDEGLLDGVTLDEGLLDDVAESVCGSPRRTSQHAPYATQGATSLSL